MKHSASRKGFRGAITSLLVMACVVVASTGALAANKLIVQDNAATPNDKFVVTDQGYIGVGTNTPAVGAHVKGVMDMSNPDPAKAAGQALTDALFISHFVGTSSSGGGGFNLYHNNDPATNGGLPLQNDRLGVLYFGSYMDATTRKAAAGFTSYADGVWSKTSTPASLSFQVTPIGTTTRIDALKINADGNVGIGTTGAKQKLQVAGGLRLWTRGARPDCSAANADARGTLWFTIGSGTTPDKIEICAIYDAAGNWGWRQINF